jgi:hypothetical protein
MEMLSFKDTLHVFENVKLNHTKKGVRNTNWRVICEGGRFSPKERVNGFSRFILFLGRLLGLTSCMPEYQRSQRDIKVIKEGLRDALRSGSSLTKEQKSAIQWYFKELRGDKSFDIETFTDEAEKERDGEIAAIRKAYRGSLENSAVQLPEATCLTKEEVEEVKRGVDLDAIRTYADEGDIQKFGKLLNQLSKEQKESESVKGMVETLVEKYIEKFFQKDGSIGISDLSRHLSSFDGFGGAVFKSAELAKLAKSKAKEILASKLESNPNFKEALSKSSHLDGILGELKLFKISTRARNPIRLGIPPGGMKGEYVSIYDKPKVLAAEQISQLDGRASPLEGRALDNNKTSKMARLIQRFATSSKKSETKLQTVEKASGKGNKVTRFFRNLVKN